MVIVKCSDPAKRLRIEWGQNLAEHLVAAQVSRKELQRRLADLGYEVSLQAVSQWIRGDTSPRPQMQAAVAKVLSVPARSLFPLPQLAS